jgi:platelet-activating factor acetylhydrolase IB subunit alpha
MALTPKQKQELHIAIASYLSSNGFQSAHDEFIKQLGGGDLCSSALQQPSGGEANILERKWTTVVRLQKRVIDLEAQVKQLESDLKESPTGLLRGEGRLQPSERRQLPRGPPLHQLAGHRSAISRVVFHPVRNLEASLIWSLKDLSRWVGDQVCSLLVYAVARSIHYWFLPLRMGRSKFGIANRGRLSAR